MKTPTGNQFNLGKHDVPLTEQSNSIYICTVVTYVTLFMKKRKYSISSLFICPTTICGCVELIYTGSQLTSCVLCILDQFTSKMTFPVTLLQEQELETGTGNGQNGIEWVRMGLNGIEWDQMGSNGITWDQMESNGIKWNQMESNGMTLESNWNQSESN